MKALEFLKDLAEGDLTQAGYSRPGRGDSRCKVDVSFIRKVEGLRSTAAAALAEVEAQKAELEEVYQALEGGVSTIQKAIDS